MAYYKAAATEDGHERAGHGNFVKMMGRANKMTATSIAVNQNDYSAEERTTIDIKKEPFYG
jgi:ABC-type ATPase involved in cell division